MHSTPGENPWMTRDVSGSPTVFRKLSPMLAFSFMNTIPALCLVLGKTVLWWSESALGRDLWWTLAAGWYISTLSFIWIMWYLAEFFPYISKKQKRRLILIGNSLGGILIKQVKIHRKMSGLNSSVSSKCLGQWEIQGNQRGHVKCTPLHLPI